MYRLTRRLLEMVSVVLLAILVTACSSSRDVSFADDVKPVLDRYCLECHQPGGAGYEASGLDMRTYDGVMKGTRNGPMVIAGDSMGSNLLVLMEGRADPSIKMPHGSDISVSPTESDIIQAWIDQGARNN